MGHLKAKRQTFNEFKHHEPDDDTKWNLSKRMKKKHGKIETEKGKTDAAERFTSPVQSVNNIPSGRRKRTDATMADIMHHKKFVVEGQAQGVIKPNNELFGDREWPSLPREDYQHRFSSHRDSRVERTILIENADSKQTKPTFLRV